MAKWRILIVDDEDDIRSIVRASLATKYEVVEAHDGVDALAKIDIVEPDFIILDVMMPLMDGFQTCEAIRRHPRFKNLSVLFLSALNTKEDMKKGYGAGATLYLAKPFDPSRLLRNVDLYFETDPPPIARKRYTMEQLKELEGKGPQAIAEAQAATLRPTPPRAPVSSGVAVKAPQWTAPQAESSSRAEVSKTPSPALQAIPRVLAVDDDPDVLAIVRGSLEPEFEVITASNGLEAIEKITTYQPDLIILDAMMPKMSGYQLCQSVRRNTRFSKTPMLFLSGKATPRDREYAMRIGASDFLAKPFDPHDLQIHLKALTNAPGFQLLPKSLSSHDIAELENRRKMKLEEKEDRLHRKEETELEKFLRENT